MPFLTSKDLAKLTKRSHSTIRNMASKIPGRQLVAGRSVWAEEDKKAAVNFVLGRKPGRKKNK